MEELLAIDGLWDYSRPEASEQAFRDLLAQLAIDAGTAYRAELLTQLARAQALQRRFADADRTLDDAEALLGGAQGRAGVRARLERGRIRNDLGETERALALFVEARDLAKSLGEQALALDAEHMLGYVASPAEAVRWNEQAIATARASSDPALRRWLGTLHMNLGAKHLAMGHFEQAGAAYEAAERARREAGHERGARDARVGRARALRLGGQPEQAWTIARALLADAGIDEAWNGYVHEEAAEALLALGRLEEAREHFAQAYSTLAADPWFPPTDTDRLERLRMMGGL